MRDTRPPAEVYTLDHGATIYPGQVFDPRAATVHQFGKDSGAMTRPTVTIRLHSETVTAQQLVKAIESLTGMLGDIDRDITGSRRAASRWLVEKLRSSEPQVTLRHEPQPNATDVGDLLVTTGMAGLQLINSEAKMLKPPDHFPLSALEKARALLKVARNGMPRVSISARLRGTPSAVHFTERAELNLVRYTSVRHEALGSVEGTLQMVSNRGGGVFNIYDFLSQQKIRCTMRRNRIREAVDAFDQRVAVHGLLQENENGTIIGVKMHRIEVLPADEQLPTVEEIAGLIPDLTGDRSTGEYMRALRDVS